MLFVRTRFAGVLYRLKGEQDNADSEFEKALEITRQNPKAPLVFSVDTFFSMK